MKYSIVLPNGWTMSLVEIKDPVEAYEAMTNVAKAADESGFEAVWLVDHFHTVPQPSQEVTLLAKMASTLDVLSHGRLNFGIGAGWYEHEYRAYGYPFPDGPERLRQLREALQVIHAMWEQEEATFEGQYYQVRGAIN